MALFWMNVLLLLQVHDILINCILLVKTVGE